MLAGSVFDEAGTETTLKGMKRNREPSSYDTAVSSAIRAMHTQGYFINWLMGLSGTAHQRYSGLGSSSLKKADAKRG